MIYLERPIINELIGHFENYFGEFNKKIINNMKNGSFKVPCKNII